MLIILIFIHKMFGPEFQDVKCKGIELIYTSNILVCFHAKI